MSPFLLFLLFAKISVFTFGGGYAMIPLFQDELVIQNHLISNEDFANMVALAQITPGPVGLNAATYIGSQQGGILSAAAGTLGVIMPSLVLMMLVASFLMAFKENRIVKAVLTGIRPLTLGLIFAAVIYLSETSVFTSSVVALWTVGKEFGVCWQGLVIFLLALAVELYFKWNPIWTLGGAALLGYLLFLF